MATTSRSQGKRSFEDEEEEAEDDEESLGFTEEDKKQKRGSSSGGSSNPVSCQADQCTADMNEAKRYHRRHKVCEVHFKAPVVLVAGIHQRFCQQCSRFHQIAEFDDTKRSCRRRLAGHNQRRRKGSSDQCPGEASN